MHLAMKAIALLVFILLLPRAAAAGGGELSRVEALRTTLERDFGFTAAAKTDRHSARVLHNLLLLLREGFPRESLSSLKSLRSFYAYAGHDTRYDLAAYHEEERAISIGGASVWRGPEATDPVILATLAHELGHAWVFGKMSAAELAELGRQEGGWARLADRGGLKAAAFLARHPNPSAEGLSLTSKLAARNVHEWFADAFAAAALQRLGEKGLLGADWKAKLRTKIGRRSWVDYNRLEPRLRAKLERALEVVVVADRAPASKH